jgi:hypothetical protein
MTSQPPDQKSDWTKVLSVRVPKRKSVIRVCAAARKAPNHPQNIFLCSRLIRVITALPRLRSQLNDSVRDRMKPDVIEVIHLKCRPATENIVGLCGMALQRRCRIPRLHRSVWLFPDRHSADGSSLPPLASTDQPP